MNRKIFISGLTAAGKTTHARIISSRYNLHYLSASAQLLAEFDIDTSLVMKDFWIGKGVHEITRRRLEDRSIDILTDQKLLMVSHEIEAGVFDTWGLPWISSEVGLRIWLDSSLETRCWKSFVSHGAMGDYAHEEYECSIKEKDEFSRNYFKSIYEFDLFKDHHVFDYIIDLSQFISAPTLSASSASIKDSDEVISAILDFYFKPSKHNSQKLENLMLGYGKNVFKKAPTGFL